MPKLDGVALYKQVRRERPTMKVLLISAYVNAPLDRVPFLRKPFHLAAFKQCLGEILALSPAAQRNKEAAPKSRASCHLLLSHKPRSLHT
jgi:YesN/AraC family two-component response regulator